MHPDARQVQAPIRVDVDRQGDAVLGSLAPGPPLGRVIDLPLASRDLSPELAMVDPDLAQVARARLHEAGSFRPAVHRGAAWERSGLPRPLPSAAVRSDVAPSPPRLTAAAAAIVHATCTATSDPRRWRWILAMGAVACLVGLYGVPAVISTGSDSPPAQASTDEGRAARAATASTERPARVSPRASERPTPTKRATSAPASPARTKRATPPEKRTFAWAPVAGAAGYEVQLFRGPDRLLLKRTRDSRLELSASWRYEDRRVELRPGTYRWYVWPVESSGAVSSKPVVQATLTIPAG